MGLINVTYIVNSIVFSAIGIFIFGAGFYLFDKMTPYHLWKEIVQEHNLALAIVVGAISMGICIIISSAIHS